LVVAYIIPATIHAQLSYTFSINLKYDENLLVKEIITYQKYKVYSFTNSLNRNFTLILQLSMFFYLRV